MLVCDGLDERTLHQCRSDQGEEDDGSGRDRLEEGDDSEHDQTGEHRTAEEAAVQLACVPKDISDCEGGLETSQRCFRHAREIDWLRRCLDPSF